jgi:ribosomal protein S6
MSEPTLYEATYILDPALQDEEVEQIMDLFEAAVEEAGGEVLGTRDFRTRRLAYRIDNFTHGTYKLLYFFGTGAVVEEIRQEMSIRQQVIRSRVFVANPHAIVGGMETDEEIEAREAAEAAAEAAAAEEAAKAEEAAEAEEAAAEEEAAEEEAAEEEAAEEAPAEEPETDEAEAEEAEADEAEEAEEAEADDAEADDSEEAAEADEDAEGDEAPETEE